MKCPVFNNSPHTQDKNMNERARRVRKIKTTGFVVRWKLKMGKAVQKVKEQTVFVKKQK